MLNDFLSEVMGLVAGKPAEMMVELLNTKKHINEFTIAKKIDLTINQTRNILYKVSDHGLVSSIRKKDKKKGWYTYYWKIEILKTLEFLRDRLLKQLEQFNTQIKNRETQQYYVCERCHIEQSEEHALEVNFTCNECGDIFTLKDNSKLLKEFKKHIDKIEARLELVNVEVAKEEVKLDKAKERVFKKEAKEKAEARAEAAAKRKVIRDAKKAEDLRLGIVKPAKKKAVKKKAVKKKVAKKKVAAKKVVKKKTAVKKVAAKKAVKKVAKKKA